MKGHLGLKPVDLVTYLALLTLIVTTLATRPANPHGLGLLLKYGGLAVVLTLLWWLDRGQVRIARPLRAFYPVIFVLILFDSFADLLPWASPIERDALLIQLDRALLGFHPTVWLERFIHPVLTELLTWAYASYYFLPVILAVALYWRGKEWDFDRAVFGMVLCFYFSYVGYFLVPAVGPRFTLAHLQTVDLHGVFVADTIRETLNALERFKHDAFPSGHTAVVLVVLVYAWQFVRGLFWVFLPLVVGLILSTVYLRFHYVIDVLAGILLAVLCLVLERMTTARWKQL
ncbi:MAG: phosphatase PAP2 family protein [candidate division NC10 bacterium]|jgi:membrane-associated phospholipid phosphatase|nr:phosphatase PAP2 family protein [candidate division NC10 bacterium]MCH7897576.1 phosphatase PAP2 family protein [candidate division NC10 bacterium]MCZ6551768.1 phosphatase PAP2 family protein [candidate division NC10 bacterium]